MILSCPDCSTRFAIDPEKLLPDGRRVKCSKCAHVWYESAPEPTPEDDNLPLSPPPLDPGEQSTVPVRNLPAVHRARNTRSAKTGWAVAAVLLVAIAAALWFGRESIARAVPQAEAIYAAVGIAAFPLPGEGLSIEFDPKTENNVLTLKGEIINTSDGVRDVPGLRVMISDKDEETLKTWEFSVDVTRLGPGETLPFTTETSGVPEGSANFSILFTNPEDTR